jgi:tetratricopeptide (TPR) repeat protein
VNNQFERAQVLVDQGRYELAEQELGQVLAAEPDYASAHALLAICLSQKGNNAAATQAIKKAIALSPDFSGFHYIYSGILIQQSKLPEAKTAITEALRLDPEDADCYGRLADIQYDQSKYAQALSTAEHGLSLDAEHASCMNLRLLALMQLGQLSLAEKEVEVALANAPENPFSHGIKGWISLHQNRIPEALQSFREALRLEPSFEWGRQGLVEALKAKNGLYRMILRFDLWRSRMSHGERTGLIIVLTLIPQVRALFLFVLLLFGLCRPLFTILLWLDPYGRLALSPQEIRQSKWLSVIILSFIPSIGVALITHQVGWFFIISTLSIVAYWIVELRSTQSNWDQRFTLGVLLLVGFAILFLAIASVLAYADLQKILAIMAAGLISMTLVGFLLFVVGAFIYKLVIALSKLLPQNRKV